MSGALARAAVVAGLAAMLCACGGGAQTVRARPVAGAVERGTASWYGDRFHGRKTASGERFDMHAMTAAHRTLPFGSVVRVTNLKNGRHVELRINDRGPFGSKKRIIDVSKGAAVKLGMVRDGVVPVELEVLSVPPPRARKKRKP